LGVSNSKKRDNDGEEVPLTLNDLCNLVVKESQIDVLQPIPLDTYKRIAITLARLRVNTSDEVEKEVTDRLIQLTSLTGKLLFDIRNSKIVDSINSIVSSSESGPSLDYSRLTEEEKYILDAETEYVKRQNIIVSSMLKGRALIMEILSEKTRSKKVAIRFVKPFGQFLGVDLSRYGPFLVEDIAVLPFENARSLIEAGTATEIEITY
jgi:DNA replication factor GINS